jgi:hypothetical protein
MAGDWRFVRAGGPAADDRTTALFIDPRAYSFTR